MCILERRDARDNVRNGRACLHTLRGEQKITLCRAAGREFTNSPSRGATTAVRLYLARTALSLLVAGDAGSKPALQRRFFDFVLLSSSR